MCGSGRLHRLLRQLLVLHVCDCCRDNSRDNCRDSGRDGSGDSSNTGGRDDSDTGIRICF